MSCNILRTGMQENQPESSAAEAAVPTDLTGRQVLAIMDTLLVMEATWHQGSALAQTIYTCHYLLHQER